MAPWAEVSGALERQPEPISLKDIFKRVRLSYSVGTNCLSGIKFQSWQQYVIYVILL